LSSLFFFSGCSDENPVDPSDAPPVNLTAYIATHTEPHALSAPAAVAGDWMNILVIGGQEIVPPDNGSYYRLSLIADDGSEVIVVNNDTTLFGDLVEWERVNQRFELHPFEIEFTTNLVADYKGFAVYSVAGTEANRLAQVVLPPSVLVPLRALYAKTETESGPGYELFENFEDIDGLVHPMENSTDPTLVEIRGLAAQAAIYVTSLVNAAAEFHDMAGAVVAADPSFTSGFNKIVDYCETEIPASATAISSHLTAIQNSTNLLIARDHALAIHDIYHGETGSFVELFTSVQTILQAYPRAVFGEGLKEEEHVGGGHGR